MIASGFHTASSHPAPLVRTGIVRLLVLAGCLALPWKATADDTVTLGQSQLGNVFSQSEEVTIPVTTTADTVNWTVRDFYGNVVASGQQGVAAGADHTSPTRSAAVGGRSKRSGAAANGSPAGPVIIHPAPAGHSLGYFELHVDAQRAGQTVAQADTTFAVLAPVDVTGMDDSPFGVMTHFAQGWNTDLMPLIARAGLRHIRDEQYWAQIETKPGQYTFDGYAPYMAAAAANGLVPLTELTFDNKVYDHDPANADTAWTPYTDAGRQGFARYAGALLDHYPTQIQTVEVWNEYNGGWCDGPAAQNRPAYYTQMLQSAYSLVKAQHPGVRVAGGAAVLTPLPWFEDLFQAGALDSMDVVVTHPYVGKPEDAATDMSDLQALMARYNHGNGPKPIWATECGLSGPDVPGRPQMSCYLVRLLTVLRASGVERIHWYLMRDYNGFVTGLLRSDTDPLGRYVPTSAYPTYANLIQMLYHAQFVRREATDLRTRAYLFDKGGTPLRVLWSTDTSPSRLILMTSQPLTLVDLMGNARTLQPQDGAVSLTVDNTPVYLLGPVDNIHETGRDLLLADSVASFSGTQGTTPGTWSYGYYHVGDTTKYAPADFQPMGYARTSWGYQWQCNFPWATVGSYGQSPSDSSGRPVWSIRRWQSNAAGPARVTGTVGATSTSGDGTGVKILVDGVEVFSSLVGGPSAPGSASFDVGVTLRAGSAVDFVVTPGPADDINFDAVDFRAQITQPAPSAPTTFNDWQDANFTAAQLADPTVSGALDDNANGAMCNLQRYAFGVSAKDPDAIAYQPQVAVRSVDGAAYLTLTFRQWLAAVDLQYSVEVTSSLAGDAGWVPGGMLAAAPIDNGDGTETVTYRDGVPLSQARARFMRLRVARR